MMQALEGLSSRARRSSLDKRLPEDKRGGLTIIIAAGDDKGDPGQKPPGGPRAPAPEDPQPIGGLGDGSRWRQGERAPEASEEEVVSPTDFDEDDEDDDL